MRSHAICARADWRDSAVQNSGLAVKADPRPFRGNTGPRTHMGKPDQDRHEPPHRPGALRAVQARSPLPGWHYRSDEQARFAPLPGDRHPAAGHALPDLPPHRRIPARQPHRGPDRALPPDPSRSARPAVPVTVQTAPACRPGTTSRQAEPENASSHGECSACAAGRTRSQAAVMIGYRAVDCHG